MLDIVPNHMAIRGGHNAWWWDVLENGPSSRYSQHFDVEWLSSEFERVLLPILGDQYGVELEAGNIKLQRKNGSMVIHYFEHEGPLAPRALGQFLRPVAERLEHPELGFVADALAELPSPNATDGQSRRRRHRDKEVLRTVLAGLCEQAAVAEAIDSQIAWANSSPDTLHEILESQNYRLAFWRIGNHELDYRRFFDIDSLVGLRVEEQEVFEATHALVARWLEDETVEGLRIDHIDGLYDPLGYLNRLNQISPAPWLLVEKILEEGEELPRWPVSGTTGYEFLNIAQRVLTHPAGEAPLDALCAELLGKEQDYHGIVERAKRLVLRDALGSDLNRLSSRLSDIVAHHRRVRDYSRQQLEELLVELCVEFPVYRTYVHPSRPVVSTDAQIVRETCEKVRTKNPRLDARLVDFLERLLLLELRGEKEVEFVLRLQQLTGPVMAKGVEDTTFYRYVRLVALNEVGGDPSVFHTPISEFHEKMAHRQVRYPEALNASSTHDTKRSEDVRARLLSLSEVPERWSATLQGFRQVVRAGLSSDAELDAATEYLIWQNLVGAWPIDRERLLEYARKAAREAKLHTSWHAPSEAYEGALETYISLIFEDPDLVARIGQFVEALAPGFEANALSQTLLKATCPGVPDIYQGTELWDLSLVDPDNRRPVDYQLRQRLLSRLESLSPTEIWEQRRSGVAKLYVLSRALSVRASLPDCFDARGQYRPLAATGGRAGRVLAFRRGESVISAVTLWWLIHGADFDSTTLKLPPGTWLNCLTKALCEGEVSLATLLGPFPCALLTRAGSEGSASSGTRCEGEA